MRKNSDTVNWNNASKRCFILLEKSIA